MTDRETLLKYRIKQAEDAEEAIKAAKLFIEEIKKVVASHGGGPQNLDSVLSSESDS
jgi:carbamate kinase